MSANDLERIEQFANTVNYNDHTLLLQVDNNGFAPVFTILHKYQKPENRKNTKLVSLKSV
jgi:hypothetical protein